MANGNGTHMPSEYVEESSKGLLGCNTKRTKEESESMTRLIPQLNTELVKKVTEGNCAIRGSRKFLVLGLIIFSILLVSLILLGTSNTQVTAIKPPVEELNTTTFDWRITNYQQNKFNNTQLVSAPFYTTARGYKLMCKVEFYDFELIFVGIKFVKSETVFLHKRTFMIMDQSQRTDKRDITDTQEPRFDSGREHKWMEELQGVDFYFIYDTLEGPSYKGVYVVDDTIHVRVILEPLEPLFRKFHSNNGTLLWNIPNYKRTKLESQQNIHLSYKSEYFYSAPDMGYRMQSHLKFYGSYFYGSLLFLKGPNDDVLLSVLPHIFTFMIVDQTTPNGNDLIKTCTTKTSYSEIKWNFIDVDMEPYLVNDSIVVKVTVEPLDMSNSSCFE